MRIKKGYRSHCDKLPIRRPEGAAGGSAPDAVISGPHIIIHRRDAIISALETVIGAAETSIFRADIAISVFERSFSAAEIRISAAVKTAGAAPAGLFPIASQRQLFAWLSS